MSARDDRDIRELLDELATTLDALRADLDDGDASEGRRGAPTPRELLRVTEEYTIPAVVATLEAAIAALELLRAVLRLADPDRATADGSDRGSTDAVGRAGESAVVGAERALSELRRALSAADLPEDGATDLAADARALSAEVESRLRAAREGDGARDDEAAGGESGVRIDVDPAERDGGPGVDGDDTADGAADDTGVDGADAVDVDAELESIRREVRDSADEEPPGRGGDEATVASGQDDGPARGKAEDDAGRESDPGREDESEESDETG